MGDNDGDARAVTSGAGPWGWHPPARRLRVGTGTRVTGGGCALGGIAEEARFALLALGTLRVVLAVLGGGHVSQGSGDPALCPCPLVTSSTPHSLPGSAQKRGHRCWSGRGSRNRSRSPGRVPLSPAQNGGHSAGTTAPCSPRGTWGHSSVTVGLGVTQTRTQWHHSSGGAEPVTLLPVVTCTPRCRRPAPGQCPQCW